MSFLQNVKNRICDNNLSWVPMIIVLSGFLFILEAILRSFYLSSDIILKLLFGSFILVLCLFAVLHITKESEDSGYITQNLSPLSLSLTIASFFSSGIAILSPGLLFNHGFDGLVTTYGISGGLFAFLLTVGSAMKRSSVRTLPELLGVRFGASVHIFALFISIAITLGLLIVGFSSSVALASRFFHLPLFFVSALSATVIACLVLSGGLSSAFKLSIVLYVLLGTSLLAFLSFISFRLYGHLLPQVSILTALQDVGPLEETLIDNGLVDFGLFKSFTKEFITVDRLNWFLLSLSLVSALSVCPPLLHIHACGRAASEARKSVAWAVLWVVLVLSAVPFASLFTRLEVYRFVAQKMSFSQLPDWILAASENDMIQLHGVSLSLTRHLTSAIQEGASSREDILDSFEPFGAEEKEKWLHLDEKVQTALLNVANKNAFSKSHKEGSIQKDFVTDVLPVAAEQSGNSLGYLTLSAFTFDAEGFLLTLPHYNLAPSNLRTIFMLAVLGAGLGFCSILTATGVNMLVQDGSRFFGKPSETSVKPVKSVRFVTLLLLLVLSFLVCLIHIPVPLILIGSLSLCAVCLFPAVLMGGWWSGSNATGCLTGMVFGLGFTIYYFLGTSAFSVPFYESWSFFSNAGPEAYGDFQQLKSSWAAAEGDAKAELFEELRLHTSGSFWSPGLANWFGIAPASAPVLGIPLALITIFLVSLLTYSRTAEKIKIS